MARSLKRCGVIEEDSVALDRIYLIIEIKCRSEIRLRFLAWSP
jgi:hypothetical protein